MPGTTPKLGLRYPQATETPDGAGGFYNLAIDIENALGQGSWTPGLAGSNAAIGANGTSSGAYFKLGKHWFLTGQILFGSGASFGNGTAIVNNLPASFDKSSMSGFGYLTNGSSEQGFVFTAFDSGSFLIRRIRDGNLAYAFDYGTPAQSSTLTFQLRGWTT